MYPQTEQNKKRLFIAVNLPEEIKREILYFLEELKKNNGNSDIKWVGPDNLHLTLHFLGYLTEEQLKKVEEVTEITTKNYQGKSFELEILCIGGFPDMERPRVIFINGREVDNRYLSELQKDLGQGLEKLGIETDSRPWKTHITLGRVKYLPSALRMPQKNIRNLKFKIKSIELMESRLSPNGAIYSILKSFYLM